MNLLAIKHWETAAQECCEEYLFQKSPQNYKKTPVKESFSVGASCKLKVFEELKEPLKERIGELIWETTLTIMKGYSKHSSFYSESITHKLPLKRTDILKNLDRGIWPKETGIWPYAH